MDVEPTINEPLNMETEHDQGPPPRPALIMEAAGLIQRGSDRETVVREMTAKGLPRSEAEHLTDTVFRQLQANAAQEQVSAGNIVAAFFAGGITSVVGAAVWLFILFQAGYEVGLIAWGIGWLAAKFISLVTGGKRGKALQVLGAASGLGSIVLVKGIIWALATLADEPDIINELFSVFDLLWVFLAVATPWRMLKGSGFTFTPGPGWEGVAPAASFE